MTHKLLLTKEGHTFFLKDISSDYHCQYGVVSKKDLRRKSGSVVKTNTGTELTVIDPCFIDQFKRIKRGAQIITLKDIGTIVSETGIDASSKVVDAGAGSGALSCFLAHLCKEVTTYELRDDFFKIVAKNKEFLRLDNLKLKQGDITKGISEKNVNVFTLDIPDPWNALETAANSLKPGGFLISYSPSIPQVMDMVNTTRSQGIFVHIKTVENIQREWEIDGRKVRPVTTQNVHTGFLSFFRKIN
ncbi:MAG TPA: methyltransferase domain-containing protein [Candidatus Nanoarchaeia archaeon]|nr:methyltransferase domain-containing protein [Candidatus Nanoarchaeia archaeon]